MIQPQQGFGTINVQPIDDKVIMRRNVERINRSDPHALRVSSEHYLWLAGLHGMLVAIVHAAGGKVDNYSTATLNVLQRIRELRRIEAEQNSNQK